MQALGVTVLAIALCACGNEPGTTSQTGSEDSDVTVGQRYRTTAQIPVLAMTHWSAPFTGGYEVRLPAGEEFEVLNDPPEGATGVYCRPARYEDLEAVFIPAEDRDAEKYEGYSLVISLVDIATNTDRAE